MSIIKALSLERGLLAALVVAAMTATTAALPSKTTPPLIASVSFVARAARKKVTAMMMYGTFENSPVA